MARLRPASPVPQQLSLDDWAAELEADRIANAPGNGTNRHASRPRVVSSSSASQVPAYTPDERGAHSSDGSPDAERVCTVDRPRHGTIELLSMPDALLTRTHLRELGLERRAVDAVFRAIPVVALPGYSRPMVRVEDYRALVERNTFRDDRVRPS
jgi:hypothetical protein